MYDHISYFKLRVTLMQHQRSFTGTLFGCLFDDLLRSLCLPYHPEHKQPHNQTTKQ